MGSPYIAHGRDQYIWDVHVTLDQRRHKILSIVTTILHAGYIASKKILEKQKGSLKPFVGQFSLHIDGRLLYWDKTRVKLGHW